MTSVYYWIVVIPFSESMEMTGWQAHTEIYSHHQRDVLRTLLIDLVQRTGKTYDLAVEPPHCLQLMQSLVVLEHLIHVEALIGPQAADKSW
jgi:hypothetical protein